MARYKTCTDVAEVLFSLKKENRETIIKIIDAFKTAQVAEELGVDASKLTQLVKEGRTV